MNSETIIKNARDIPQVEKLTAEPGVAAFEEITGRSFVTAAAREAASSAREKILGGGETTRGELINDIISRLTLTASKKLRRIINCTGILIHTNLGRAPLGEEIFSRMSEELAGYVNLEFSIPDEKRGSRGGFAEALAADITGAEDVLIVNNNASSVFLILSALARDKEVIVSRGELIQIGGGFRIPDIMDQTGALLIETGTTNITTLDDYRNAVTDRTAMIFSAHTSNFRIEGFTETPSIEELAGLKNSSVILVRDLGSGNLIHGGQTLNGPSAGSEPQIRARDLTGEPTPGSELAAGADIVCFSGDKLTGGCQAGIIAGRRDIIALLKKHPLMRMLRVDKVTYFILQETLIKYHNSSARAIPLWGLAARTEKQLSSLITKFTRALKHPEKQNLIKKIRTKAAFGGGSNPGEEIDSLGVRIDIPDLSAARIFTLMLRQPVPVIGSVSGGYYTIDFMTVAERDIAPLAEAVDRMLNLPRNDIPS